MTVFLVCPLSTPDTDLSPTEQFGNLETINTRFVYGDEIVDEKLPQGFVYNLEHAANRFKPREDYVLIGGDHVQFAFLVAVLAAQHGEVRILRWDRMARGYVPITLQIW